MGEWLMAEYQEPATSRLGRFIDYVVGRNALIGVASLMLLCISGFATWSGMTDFIIGVSTSPGSTARETPLGLSVTNEFLVIAIVVTLTFLMWLALRETFAASRFWRERMITLPLYIFLALWSIGFGYGFWWSLIAGEEATRTSLSGLQEDARDAGAVVAARLDAVRIQLDNVVSWSETQMAREEQSGGSCGIPSGAGQGPLYNARRGVRDSVVTLRDGITNSWVAPVQADLEQLRRGAARLEGATVAERQQTFENQASEIRGKARSIAARSNQFGISTASEMRALADAVSVAPGESGFSCYDPTLAQRLRQAADQAAAPAVLNLREAAFTEGAAGVANAVKKLWNNVAQFVTSIPSRIMGDEQEAAETGAPMTGRDLIALLATLGIDLGLFALMIINPPAQQPVRTALKGARLSLPPETVIRHIRDAIQTAIARAPNADFEWVRKHFLHHRQSAYFIIPNLHGGDPDNKEETAKALAMNQLAGVLNDLDLVRWPKKEEMEALIAEEKVASQTDLTEIRKEWIASQNIEGKTAEEHKAKQIQRNHGLFSKAERALEFAGWGEGARRDVEIFVFEDTEGLTPLLTVLNSEALGIEEPEIIENAKQEETLRIEHDGQKQLPAGEPGNSD